MDTIIILDAGHAGPTKDGGAVGPGGTLESDRALEITLKIKEGLTKRGITVVMTREVYDQPETDDLAYRTDLANKYDAAAFISIHCNAAENPTAEGYEIWTTPGDTGADSLAEAVLAESEKQMPGLYLRKDLSDGDGDKEARFYVLKYTDAPAILIETGFISNPVEEALLATDEYQQQIADVVICGLETWLKGGE